MRVGPPVIGLGGMPVAVSVVVEVPTGKSPVGLSCHERSDLPGAAARSSSGLHQRQHTLHDLIDVQAGGIEEDGVFGRPQRRHRALGITGVAGENLA